eukprot:Skav222148  [mRNA]  locus=scaffold4223:59694:62536:+ [translate_table: standard]
MLVPWVLASLAWPCHTAHFVVPGDTWNFWRSQHPNPILAERQHTEWRELTVHSKGEWAVGTPRIRGICLLRLGPFGELPSHFHPAPYGEIYHFTRGNGQVKLGEYTPEMVTHDIRPGLHVNIPAQTLHGIEAGSEGCEFLWMFPGQRWKDEIPYLYADPQLPHRNVPEGYVAPLPLGVSDWDTIHANVTRMQSRTGRWEFLKHIVTTVSLVPKKLLSLL